MLVYMHASLFDKNFFIAFHVIYYCLYPVLLVSLFFCVLLILNIQYITL